MALLKKPVRKLAPAGGLKKPPRAPAPGRGVIKRGGAFDRVEGEKKRYEAERNKPWEVQVPVGGKLDVYLLDPDEPFATYQHDIGGGPNSKPKTYPCLQDTGENCPLCQSEGKAGYYILYYTAVIPKETYENKEGKMVTRRFQKKLFPIKIKMMEKYKREFIKQGGSMRGVKLTLIRDGKMDPKTGNDFEVMGRLSEAKIQEFARGEAKNAEGKFLCDKEMRERIRKLELDKPFDYAKAFPKVDAKTLAQMAGAGTKYGGEGLGSADFDEDAEEDSGWGEGD